MENKKQIIANILSDSARKVTSLSTLLAQDQSTETRSALLKNHALMMQISKDMHSLAVHVEKISPLLKQASSYSPEVKNKAVVPNKTVENKPEKKPGEIKKTKKRISSANRDFMGAVAALITEAILKRMSATNQKVEDASKLLENIEEPLQKGISEDFNIEEDLEKPKEEEAKLPELPKQPQPQPKPQAVTTAEGAVLQTETAGPVMTEQLPTPPPPAPPPSPAKVPSKPMATKMPEQTVGDAIKEASNKVGVDESIMLAMAKQESGFKPDAKAGTSSAKGLYQFIDSTWNSMVSRFSKSFPELLKGPYDALASAIAGALYIKENATFLKKNNIPVTGTNIYASHFLGAGGARTLLTAPPNQIAAEVPGLQAPAAANKNIFFVKGDVNKPRTVDQVIEVLYNKVGKTAEEYKIALNEPASGTQLASVSADVNASKRTQRTTPSTTIVNNNNMTVIAGNAPQGGITMVARPAGTA